MKISESITIHEITLRDGLQNLNKFVPTEKKVRLLELLVDAGALNLECTAFVHPVWVPQMADAKEIIQQALKFEQARKFVLIPNMKGYDLAAANGINEVVTFLSASEIHNKNNVNRTVKESLEELVKIGKRARKESTKVRVNIATAFGYLPEESITAEQVLSISETLVDAGYEGITLCDTTGIASPDQVYALVDSMLKHFPKEYVAVHLHQQSGIEFANAYAALSAGVRIFDSAVGGLGGCPYAKDASGNIATEKLVKMFASMGFDCGIDQEKIMKAAAYAKEIQLLYAEELKSENYEKTSHSDFNNEEE